MMAHVDLCSGIGGFALGFQWAGLSKPVLFCDIEPWARQILEKHWPDVPIAENVKELANDPDGNVPDCDILTAGYPCQPFSHAGKRLGHADDRHIWPYILQIVAQKRPAWCVFENVYGHVSMGLDQVLLDLETQGYASRTLIVPACGVDAPHRRDRIWIIAKDVGNASSSGQRGDNGRWAGQKPENRCEDVADTDNKGLQGQERQRQTRAQGAPSRHVAKCGGDVADTDSQRGRRRNTQRQDAEDAGQPSRHTRNNTRGMESWLTEPSICGMADGIPRWLDEPRDTPRVATGVKQRAARLKGLGNAIVPQIAMKIGEAIKQCEAEL